jgi:hypothetical protein
MQKFKSKLKFVFFLIIFHIISINSELSSYTLSLIKNTTNEQIFKNYLKYDNENYTDVLYNEFIIGPNSTEIPYYKINVFWFTNLTIGYFLEGTFCGVAQTKVYNTYTFSDIILCRSEQALLRCDDYHMKIDNLNEISSEILDNFDPILDVRSGGSDDLLNYNAYNPNFDTSSISPYKSLFKMSFINAFESDDTNYDLNFGLENNITVFIGNFYTISSETGNKKVGYKILRAITENMTNLILNQFRVKINSMLITLIFVLIIL